MEVGLTEDDSMSNVFGTFHFFGFCLLRELVYVCIHLIEHLALSPSLL
jgi:hypothetical protein